MDIIFEPLQIVFDEVRDGLMRLLRVCVREFDERFVDVEGEFFVHGGVST